MNPSISDHKPNHTSENPVQQINDLVVDLIKDGLRHGFFDYSIECEIINAGKRQLIIRAGQSFKFPQPRLQGPPHLE
jgi:hypothetical protein